MDTTEPPLDGPGEESQLYCKPVAKKPKTAASSDDDSSDDERPAPAPAAEPIDVDADDASDGDDLDRFGPRTEVDLRLGDAYASGAVVLACVVAPIKWLIERSGGDAVGDAVAMQIVARLALGACTALALARFRRALASRIGAPASVAFALLTATSFHQTFYASRTLPNVFALILTTHAMKGGTCQSLECFALAPCSHCEVFALGDCGSRRA